MKQKEITIKVYQEVDQNLLFSLIEQEGEDWKDYWKGDGKIRYQTALSNSIVYLLEGELLCGYIRCRDDDGFGIYVYDLLVDNKQRGKEFGRLLIEQVVNDYPTSDIYVMSSIDPYYEKLGYEKEGSIYSVVIPTQL